VKATRVLRVVCEKTLCGADGAQDKDDGVEPPLPRQRLKRLAGLLQQLLTG